LSVLPNIGKKVIEQSIDLFWILSECHQRLTQRKSEIHTEKKEKLSKMEMGLARREKNCSFSDNGFDLFLG
jgi:hypothetical protein